MVHQRQENQRLLELSDLQQEWINLFWKMEKSERLNPDLLAAPFLSVEPEGYDPDRRKTILYIGKATGGAWGLESFKENPSRNARRAFTTEFLDAWIATGLYRSSFWQFAKKLSSLLCDQISCPLQNIVWSNIAKIGVKRGNPNGDYLAFQEKLASQTLPAEIRFYRPSLVVFVVGDWGERLLINVFSTFNIGWDDSSWQQLGDRAWARAAARPMPAILCLSHPQGKTRELTEAWVRHASLLLRS